MGKLLLEMTFYILIGNIKQNKESERSPYAFLTKGHFGSSWGNFGSYGFHLGVTFCHPEVLLGHLTWRHTKTYRHT